MGGLSPAGRARRRGALGRARRGARRRLVETGRRRVAVGPARMRGVLCRRAARHAALARRLDLPQRGHRCRPRHWAARLASPPLRRDRPRQRPVVHRAVVRAANRRPAGPSHALGARAVDPDADRDRPRRLGRGRGRREVGRRDHRPHLRLRRGGAAAAAVRMGDPRRRLRSYLRARGVRRAAGAAVPTDRRLAVPGRARRSRRGRHRARDGVGQARDRRRARAFRDRRRRAVVPRAARGRPAGAVVGPRGYRRGVGGRGAGDVGGAQRRHRPRPVRSASPPSASSPATSPTSSVPWRSSPTATSRATPCR